VDSKWEEAVAFGECKLKESLQYFKYMRLYGQLFEAFASLRQRSHDNNAKRVDGIFV
jgi:hypothetical protein